MWSIPFIGAVDRTRTDTKMVPSRDFKSLASASSATTACFWRLHPDLNWRIKVLQTSALPLGYGALFLERETGFEPATSALARQHSTTESLPQSPLKRYT